MRILVYIALWGARVFLCLTTGIVAWKAVGGRVSLKGILTGEFRDGRTYFSPGRVQLLCCVAAVALNYVFAVIARSTPTQLPNIHVLWVVLAGASATVYLAEKAWALLLARKNLETHERGSGNAR